MKTNETTRLKPVRGTGYLAGALTGIIAAIATFVITENMAVSIPVLAGLSIPLGIIIEKRLQSGAEESDKRSHKLMIILIATGLFFFLSLIFITKFI